MSRVFDVYRAVHDQGFVPIFVDDQLDSKMLLEACLEAGVKVIEYTLRRKDANTMIPWIRENYPDLYILAGSTIDDDKIVAHAKSRYPQLLTLSELDSIGVDGFISMMSFSEDTVRKYSPRRLIIPGVETINEALLMVKAGAHFVKLLGPGSDMVRKCRAKPAFDYCPVFITGGMTTERIHEAVSAGAMVVGSGFDLTLRMYTDAVDKNNVARSVARYVQVTRRVRNDRWPELAAALGADDAAWLAALPHYHPF